MTKKKAQLITLLAACAAAGSLLSAGTAQASTETPMSAVLSVRYNGRGRVRLLDQNGNYQDQYVSRNSKWKVFGYRQVNGQTLYRIGSEKQFIPAQFTNLGSRPASDSGYKASSNGQETHLNGTVRVSYTGRGGVRLLNGQGQYTSQTVKRNSLWHVFGKKVINNQVMYRIGSDKQWIPAKYVAWVASSAAVKYQNSGQYRQNHLVLPAGYTKANLLAAYRNPATAYTMKAASRRGIVDNAFYPESKADDQMQVNPSNLTAAQQAEISQFACRIINEARRQIGVGQLTVDARTQKLANDIAAEYQTHNKGINDSDHYVEGIVRAARNNGLHITGNAVEDEGGFYAGDTISMTMLKSYIYWNIKQMLFGGAISDNGPFNEFYHAGDLLNVRGEADDNQSGSFGLSFSRQGSLISTHFIHVSQLGFSYWK
ncbi:MAG: SEC10/PgrA surface exclusion domain-containing protein [Lactobacillus sp.]|jgi:hypothetical protein|nr:SEC10/PgrA surface exclusion domain-containing protein [Lactobacillus sp.]MCH3905472.1 SEC10/PgrA surface exclusion domain-containing protein [Lactobacillus sp.]MCI1467128.1 SEC10/PgrA surface exclusion domain-containing protein [Lactobacillus sp.]MCI1482072.1 SEC10/PgrA surface exclusion domain-containing protein [Lactobacillus sp.]MCI1884313.1 SEC10/PgrA surface exclusion domain-containing protein [Lactobacillus sp.]